MPSPWIQVTGSPSNKAERRTALTGISPVISPAELAGSRETPAYISRKPITVTIRAL